MKKLFFGNLSLKISALILSVFLWLFVTSRGQSEMTLEVPLQFKDVPVGLGIADVGTKLANVTVRGQERLMKSVKPSDVAVFVDLSKAKKGESTYYINKDDIKLPYAMSVINITPSQLRVILDETVSKVVPVRPLIIGVPDQGYFVKGVRVEPTNIKIQGLRSEVRRVREARTEVVDVTGLSETLTQDVNVEAGSNITLDTHSVKITVIIAGGKS